MDNNSVYMNPPHNSFLGNGPWYHVIPRAVTPPITATPTFPFPVIMVPPGNAIQVPYVPGQPYLAIPNQGFYEDLIAQMQRDFAERMKHQHFVDAFFELALKKEYVAVENLLSACPSLANLRIICNTNISITPLVYSFFLKDIQLAELLLKYGADVNGVTEKNHHTTLHLAAAGGSVEFVNLLLTYHANSLLLDSTGYTPLLRAMIGNHELAARQLSRSSGDFPKMLLVQKLIALRFSLNVNIEFQGRKIPLQGCMDEFMTKPFKESLLHYFQVGLINSHIPSTIWDQNDWNEIFEIIDTLNQVKDELISDQFQWITQKTRGLLTGWDEHATGIIFDDHFLISCNKGIGSVFPGLTLHQITDYNKTQEFLKKAATNHRHKANEELFTKTLYEFFPPLLTFSLKGQTAGNCPWVLMKMMMRSVIILKLLRKGYNLYAVEQFSKSLYKHWSLRR